MTDEDKKMLAETLRAIQDKGELTDEVLQRALGDKYEWDGEKVVERESQG